MTKNEFGDITMLKVNDLRCIDVFEAKLEKGGKMLPLYGPNGAGKSTIIDSLEILFSGGKIPDDLIRHGKKEAFIEAMSDRGIIIRKRVRRKGTDGSQVTDLVLTKDNELVPSPQKALKELFGGLASPNRLADLSGAKLYEEVCVASGVQTAGYDYDIEADKNEASNIRAEMRVLGVLKDPGERPKELADLPVFDVNEYQELKSVMQVYEDEDQEYEVLSQRIEKGKTAIETMKEQLNSAEHRLEQLEDESEKIDAKRQASNWPQDTERFALLEKAMVSTEELKVYTEYEVWKEKAEALAKEAVRLTAHTNKKKDEKRAYLANADLGVPGLSLNEDKTVSYNGNLWENTCFSDKMKASAILTMKGMDKDQLNLMYMEHGESLSKAKRDELAEECKKNGVHLIMEVFVENEAHAGDDGIILHPVTEEPVVPEIGQLAELSQGVTPETPLKKDEKLPFGRPIPSHILETPAGSNPFDSVDDDLFGGKDEDIDF